MAMARAGLAATGRRSRLLRAMPRFADRRARAERPLNIKGAQIYGRPISRLLRSLLDGSYEAQQF
ncbi:hypothetical protein FHS81_003674, partial [Pseudochelatococcus contaminans]|nr:hypothetical protein [Pseudochelatococcus contaminans]